MNDKKMVNGAAVELTNEEQAARDAEILAWEANAEEREQAALLPDVAAQVASITAALMTKGALSPNDVSEDVLSAVNLKLEDIGENKIPLSEKGP